jgi:hypothetical protein
MKNRQQLEEIMTDKNPIFQLNRQSYQEFQQDGIIDILVGASLLGFALWLQLNIPLFAFICWLSVSFYKLLKNKLTIPRIGFVRFEEDRKQFILSVIAASIVLVLLLVARFLILEGRSPQSYLAVLLRKNHPYIMSSIGAVLMIAFGLWRGLNRFKLYGLLFLGLLVVFFLGNIPGQMALFSAGGGIFVIGCYLLITFLRKHPLIGESGANA